MRIDKINLMSASTNKRVVHQAGKMSVLKDKEVVNQIGEVGIDEKAGS